MALDYHSILSQGLYFDPDEATSDAEKAIRMASHGLLEVAPLAVEPTGEDSGGLNDVGSSTRL